MKARKLSAVYGRFSRVLERDKAV